MTILVCAATRAELAACARGIASSGVAQGAFATLLTGWGSVQAARSLGEHLDAAPRPSLVVSSGFAGALTPDLPIGTWVTATALFALKQGERMPLPNVLRHAKAPAIACTMISAPELVLTTRARADAAAEAVDMESAGLAHVAARHDLPFMVLRFISDSPQHPLPGFLSPFTAAMTAKSTRERLVNAARGVRGALGDPGAVVRLVRDGSTWTRDMAAGWSQFARQLASP